MIAGAITNCDWISNNNLFIIETPVFPADYALNGVYIHNGNQYCPIAIMLRRDCSYTMQLSTTRRTCQERNEGDQWIFNCQYGTDSCQNFEIILLRCIIDRRIFPGANYNAFPLYSLHALMRFRELTIDLRQVALMSHYDPTMTNQIKVVQCD